MAGHDGRVLATHLHDARPRPRPGERVEEGHAHFVRAGEDDAVHARVILERLADRGARAHDEVDDAGRDAGIDERLDELDRHQRRRRGGLQHDGVAGHQRGTGRAGREGRREVERADDREHAVRPEDRPGVDGGVAEVAHRVVVELVVLGGLGVVADEVGGLLDLAERLDPVLADLDGHERRVLHQPVADEVGGPLQDRETAFPAEGGPLGLGGAGGLHGVVDVGRACPTRTSRPGCRYRSASGPRTCRRRPARHRPRSCGGSRPAAPERPSRRSRTASAGPRCRHAGWRR